MQEQLLQELMQKYLDETISPDELDQLFELAKQHYDPEKLDTVFAKAFQNPGFAAHGNEFDRKEILAGLLSKINQQTPPIVSISRNRETRWIKYAAAACILLMAGAGSYWLLSRKDIKQNDIVKAEVHDVKAPIANRAMITLSNGQKVYLDSAANGTLASQGNINLVKTGNGVISYSPSSSSPVGGGQGEAIVYNTLSNPRGSQPITLTLSDGTQVWLNAESSLKYPVSFTGKERKVEITGEAYFEVAHNAAKPFKVLLPPIGGAGGGQGLVEVLGTHFNINTYNDQSAYRTTLLEGSVKISLGGPTVRTIKPGEQAVIAYSTKVDQTNIDLSVFSKVNMESVMAWKNGRFDFDGMKLRDAMQQLARWYDIEIKYEGNNIPDMEFYGQLSRDKTLAALLAALKDVGVHFRIENKTLVVLP